MASFCLHVMIKMARHQCTKEKYIFIVKLIYINNIESNSNKIQIVIIILKEDLKTSLHNIHPFFACFRNFLAKCTRSQCVQDECYLKTNNDRIGIDTRMNKPTAMYV